jgi:hypothetical protein
VASAARGIAFNAVTSVVPYFGPALQLISQFVPLDQPGWQKFGAKVFPILMAKSGGKLTPKELRTIAKQTALGGTTGIALRALQRTRPNRSPTQEGDDMIGTNSLGSFVGATGGGLGGLGGTDWGGLISQIGNATFGYLGAKQQNKQLNKLLRLTGGGGLANSFVGPAAGMGAGSILGSGGSILAGAGAGLAGLLGLGPDMLPGGLEEGGTGMFGPDLFAPTAASSRQRMIHAEHPTSGEMVYWRPVGRPVLFSGDLQLLKRTRKTIGRYCAPAGIQRARRGRRRR